MSYLEHVARNTAYWGEEAARYVDGGRRNWAAEPIHFPLVRGIAETLPFPDASFDVVMSEYELRPGDEQASTYPFVSKDWAQRWPSEEVWKARKIQ